MEGVERGEEWRVWREGSGGCGERGSGGWVSNWPQSRL